jgi:hypothetical protein
MRWPPLLPKHVSTDKSVLGPINRSTVGRLSLPACRLAQALEPPPMSTNNDGVRCLISLA